MKQLYYRHAKTQAMYQRIGSGHITLSEGRTLRDMDTVFVVNGGDKPPYVFVTDERTQVRKGDQVLEVTLQVEADVVIKSGDELILYRAADGTYWTRTQAEFYDGRFIELDPELNPVGLAAAPDPALGEGFETMDAVVDTHTARTAVVDPTRLPPPPRGFGPLSGGNKGDKS